MSSLANLAILSNESRNFIIELSQSGKSHTRLVSLIIGKALSTRYPIPISEIKDMEGYLGMNVMIEANTLVSKLNEYVRVDIDDCINYMKNLYLFRYYTLTHTGPVYCLDDSKVIQDFFGLTQFVDNESLSMLTGNSVFVSKIHNGAIKFFADVSSKEVINSNIASMVR